MNDKDIGRPQYSGADADKIIACADGLCALLYLHILRRGSFSLSSAARDLKRQESEVALAAQSLRRLGILQDEYLPSEELPEYDAQDWAQKAQADDTFEELVFEAQSALGKLLSSNDLRILLGIYDHLGLPAEVIVLLINHCIERYRHSHGEGRMPTMRYIEKEAWHWARTETLTLDMAEEHIRLQKERYEDEQRVKAVLQINGRDLTASELKYVQAWLDMGFSPEALSIAHDRTVISTGRLVWKYMDKIVSSWHEKNLHTPKEIESGDTRNPRKNPRTEDNDAENMRRMMEARMKKDG